MRGLLVKENLPRFGEGDRVGFMLNFARNQVPFRALASLEFAAARRKTLRLRRQTFC